MCWVSFFYFFVSPTAHKKIIKRHQHISVVYIKQGQTENAVEWMQKAVGINPGYVRGYFNLGNLLLNTGKFQSAVNSFKQALEIDPANKDSASVRKNLDAAEQQLSDAKNKLLDYTLGNKIKIENNLIIQLLNNVIVGKVLSADTIILEKNKYKFTAYTEKNNYEVFEESGTLKIHEIFV